MSFAGSRQCKCPRWALNPTGQAVREWVIVQRHQNRSSYNGVAWSWDRYPYAIQKGKWSHVLCLTCGWHWRTQAGYVDRLPDLDDEGQLFCYRWLKEGKPANAEIRARLQRKTSWPNLAPQSMQARNSYGSTIGKDVRR